MTGSEADAPGQAPKKGSKEPRYTKLTQQELPACKPILEPTWVVFIFFAIGVVMIPIGAVCLYYGGQAYEVSTRYDQTCFNQTALAELGIPMPQNNAARESIVANPTITSTLPYTCTVQLTVKENLKAPVFLWYELDGFYQNHRRYVRSRSDLQLQGDTGASTSNCVPVATLYNSSTQAQYTILPCGLVAFSFFNDTYYLQDPAKAPVPISGTGIALKSDIEYRFANISSEFFNLDVNTAAAQQLASAANSKVYVRGGGSLANVTVTAIDPTTGVLLEDGGQLTMQQNERFIVWMRTAALPRFRKLWGKINANLPAGTYTVYVVNRYNTFAFNGKKSVVLGTTTWLGGHNQFLGIAYLVTGGASILLGLVYCGLRYTVFKARKFGEGPAGGFTN